MSLIATWRSSVCVEGAVDRRHPAGADLGVEPVPAAQLHAYERAHLVGPIVADLAVSATVFTCSSSAIMAYTFVIVGLRRTIGTAVRTPTVEFAAPLRRLRASTG